MLIEFTIRNFMSYRDEVSLSMAASTTVKECESNDGYWHSCKYPWLKFVV